MVSSIIVRLAILVPSLGAPVRGKSWGMAIRNDRWRSREMEERDNNREAGGKREKEKAKEGEGDRKGKVGGDWMGANDSVGGNQCTL